MAITKFQPEVWASTLLSVLEESLVYASTPCVNRDYEGEISAAGDTVHIVSISDPSIVTYSKDTDLTVETLTDDEQTLVIDQAKAFAFEVDDIDMRQSKNGGALMTEAAKRAGFGLRDVADTYVVNKMIAAAGSALGLIDASSTATNVYDDVLVPAWVALEEQSVPTEGRWIVLPPAAYGKLLLDSRFIKANESGSNTLRNGVVGSAAGFTILTSNNAPDPNRTGIHATTTSGDKDLVGAAGTFTQADVGLTVAGTGVGAANHIVSVSEDGTTATTAVNSSASAAQTDIAISGGGKAVVAGSAIATSYAEQINKVEAFRPEKRFADALKGLHLYGGRVVRPEGLVVASVKTS